MDQEDLKVDLQTADILNIPFTDNYFDAVIDNECIYSNNYKNSQIILQEIARVLKPKGKLYSRTFSDEMYIGENPTIHAELEYSNITDGPLKGKGFLRLSSKETINKLYSKSFKIQSIDYLAYTNYNEQILTKEWIVICSK